MTRTKAAAVAVVSGRALLEVLEAERRANVHAAEMGRAEELAWKTADLCAGERLKALAELEALKMGDAGAALRRLNTWREATPLQVARCLMSEAWREMEAKRMARRGG